MAIPPRRVISPGPAPVSPLAFVPPRTPPAYPPPAIMGLGPRMEIHWQPDAHDRGRGKVTVSRNARATSAWLATVILVR